MSQNVIFIETPSVTPSLDVRGFDDEEFTYDDHDDMLRDVRNYTFNHSAGSLSPERAVGDAVGDLPAITLKRTCETTNRDLGLASAGSTLANDAPGTSGGTPEKHTVKGEFPDVAHRDGTFGFTEYVHGVKTSQPNVPRTIKEARATPEAAQWNAAAEHEIAGLEYPQVYQLAPRSAVPAGRKRINSKWVFKRKANGSFKARAVAQGWNQVSGLDSGNIYAPVCMIQSVRIICCIVVHFGLLLLQMDVSTASLYADIQELVFVEQPPGFEVRTRMEVS